MDTSLKTHSHFTFPQPKFPPGERSWALSLHLQSSPSTIHFLLLYIRRINLSLSLSLSTPLLRALAVVGDRFPISLGQDKMILSFSKQRLEVLALARNSITGVEPSYLKFPCLKSLSMSFVSISALDLSLLLSACPKLETLSMVSPEIAMSDSQATVELSSSSLKDFFVESFGLDKFILEADLLESLHLKDCTFEVFELIGKGTLKVLKIDDVSVIHLDIGESTENLEVVDVCNFTIMWPKFYHMISKASKLNRLRLWGVVFDDEDEVVDIETISVCFPRLTHLSLSYDLRDGVLHYGLQGLSLLMNVVVLELGWTTISDLFSVWVAGLLERCPNLKKLVIYGFVSEVKTHEECQIFARFTEFILQLGRKYMHVKVEFEYE